MRLRERLIELLMFWPGVWFAYLIAKTLKPGENETNEASICWFQINALFGTLITYAILLALAAFILKWT